MLWLKKVLKDVKEFFKKNWKYIIIFAFLVYGVCSTATNVAITRRADIEIGSLRTELQVANREIELSRNTIEECRNSVGTIGRGLTECNNELGEIIQVLRIISDEVKNMERVLYNGYSYIGPNYNLSNLENK